MLLMDVRDFLSAINWSSSSAINRHYLTTTSRPQQPVAVPGDRCAPDDWVEDPAPDALDVVSSV